MASPGPTKFAKKETVITVRNGDDVGTQDFARNAIVSEHMLVFVPKQRSSDFLSEIHKHKAEWEEQDIGYKFGPAYENKGSESPHEHDLLELFAYRPGSVSDGTKPEPEGKLEVILVKLLSTFDNISVVAEPGSQIPELVKTLRKPGAPTTASPDKRQ
jgi:hypothetical protein